MSVLSTIIMVLFFISPDKAFANNTGLAGDARFSRQLDAMRWHYFGNFDLSTERFSLQLDNTYRSRLYLSDGKAQNIQDENDLNLNMRQWLTDNWAVTGEAQSYSFTTTNLQQTTGHLGVLYNPHEQIELSLSGGLMSDRRSDHLDQGWSGVFRAHSRPVSTGDFTFHPTAEAHYARINPREYSTLRVASDNLFEVDDFMMRADLKLSSARRESYQPSSFFNRELTNIIESIRNDSTAFDIQVRLPVMDDIDVSIDLFTLNNTRFVTSRPVSDDIKDDIFDTRTQRQEIALRSTADFQYHRSRFSAGFNFGYINRGSRLIHTEDFPEDQVARRNEILRNSNFDQSRFEIFTRNRIRISDSNELAFQAQTGILRYDTPEVNLDDRDELSYQFRLTNRHIFSPHLDLSVRAGGEATHYVYLSATRSIENNWRRTIRLSPSLRWQPFDWLELRNSFRIRATYTVEDFELEGRPKSDQSSREYSIQSEINMQLSENWMFEIGGSRNELQIGRLFWDSFQEMPTDTLITYDSDVMMVYQTEQHRIGVGGRFFMRRDYLPQATLTTEVENDEGVTVPVSRTAPGIQISRQLGPSIDIDLRFSSGNRLIIRGWLQRQRTRRSLYITYDDHVKEAFQSIEGQSTKRTYPNMEIRAVFSF